MMTRRSRRDDRGATAVLVALLSTVLFGAAALAVDYSSLVMERQNLHDHIDSAAQSGAFELPSSGASAAAAARSIALAQDSTINPTVTLFCVVASTGSGPYTVNTTQIPSTCYPGPAPYTASGYPGLRCNESICAIPCPTTGTGIKCNTVNVADNKTVGFNFARILGINTGRTGSVASAACKGSCGAEVPNPMDVVVLADRTASLSNSDRGSMVNAIKSMMLTMDPSMHYLSLGTIDKSAPTSTCASAPRQVPSSKTTGTNYKVTPAWTAADLQNSSHKWIPTDFSRDYVTGAPGSRVAKTTDPVYRAVNCITGSEAEYGTHLAAPMKEAAQKLLGLSGSNLQQLHDSYPRPAEELVKKVLILETDGAPNEFVTSGTNTTSNADVRYAGAELRNTDGNVACQELLKVAESARREGILVITIGFGEVTSAECDRWNDFGGKTGSTTSASPKVRDILAAAASPHPGTGAPSAANACNTSSLIAAENADGDFFFCAATGSELANIFTTAISQVSKGIRLVKLP